jgi:hypothetical protein
MSRINITKEHYDYVNTIVKIFGFNNLADYMTVISYEKIKKNTKEITVQLSITMNKFKLLFSLKEFDLARIDYKFETVEHCYAFFKKILEYLFVPYYTFREKGKQYVRLIQQNNLYRQYIMNLDEIGQNAIIDSKNLLKEEDDYNELSTQLQMIKKLNLLTKLGEICYFGVELSQNYSMESNYFAMKYEYELHKIINDKQSVQYEESEDLKKIKELDDYEELPTELQMLKKIDILKKLDELINVDVKLSQNYNTESDYFTMKYEYMLHKTIREKYYKQSKQQEKSDESVESVESVEGVESKKLKNPMQLLIEQSKTNKYSMSEIKQNYAKKISDTDFLITKELSLTKLTHLYDCITNITIELYEEKLYLYSATFDVKLMIGLSKEKFKKISKHEKCIININIPNFVKNAENVLLSCKLNDLQHSKPIFKITVSGFKFKANTPKYIFNSNILLLDIYTNSNGYEYYIMNGRFMSGGLGKNIQPGHLELTNNDYVNPFEANCEYSKKLKLYNDKNAITERNMVVLNNDVWITSIDNDNDNGYNNENEKTTGLYNEMVYFCMLSKYKKYGYSLFNKSITIRKNFGLEINIFFKYDFNLCVVENDNLTIDFMLPRNPDMISKFKILNKVDRIYDFTVQIQQQNQVYYETKMNTSNLTDIKLPSAMFCYGTLEPRILISVNKTYLNDWKTLLLSVSGIYVDNIMKTLCVEKVKEIL